MTKTEREKYAAYLKDKKIPVLTLEHKWHKLFPNGNKPSQIAQLESQVNDCVKREGGLRTDIKDLKKLKKKLMDGIVQNMEDTARDTQSKKMEESQRLIREINEKLENCENELLELPEELKAANVSLMLETMDYCYNQLHTNKEEIEQISNWIADIRVELKKNILRKQDKEIRNKMMYTYMHNIFGPEVINIFDLEEEEQENQE